MSFLASEAESRLKNNTIIELNRIINWKSLQQRMGNLGRSSYGPKGYNALSLLKALVLQSWYSLSDTELEEALRVRLDFMVVTGLEEVPDSTTRNLLISRKLMDELLTELNGQLEQRGLKVRESKGAILDATIVESSCRPNKLLETVPVDREEEVIHEVSEIKTSSDPDASWLKKGKKYYYGYKGYAVTDIESGYVENVHVTPASVSEMKEFENIIPKIKGKGRRVYTDKGSASKANRKHLSEHGFKNGIMEKAVKSKSLGYWQRYFNKQIAKVRYRVEQCFGTLKRKFKFLRASYSTVVKVHGQMVLKSMAFNLLKAINMAKA